MRRRPLFVLRSEYCVLRVVFRIEVFQTFLPFSLYEIFNMLSFDKSYGVFAEKTKKPHTNRTSPLFFRYTSK